MPALISCYLHAKKALGAFHGREEASVETDAFLWGAQGPAFLACRPCFPWWKSAAELYDCGMQLTRQSPSAVLGALRKKKDPISDSYLLGMICFYTLKRIADPFVCAQTAALKRQYPQAPDSFLRCQLETSLDVILLRYERAELPTEFNLKKAFPKNPAVQEKIAEMYAPAILQLCGRAIEEKDILLVEKDCRTRAGLQNDRTGLKKQFLQRLERKHGKYFSSCVFRGIMEDGDFDYANILSSPWSWPENTEVRAESFLELFERSAAESARLITQAGKSTAVENLLVSLDSGTE